MRLLLLLPFLIVLGCDDSSTSKRRDKSNSDRNEAGNPEEQEKPMRLSGKIRDTLAADAHPTDLSFSQGYERGKRRNAGTMQSYRKEEGGEVTLFSARVRTEANKEDALRYFTNQAKKYLDGGKHTKTKLPDIGDGAIEGIALERSNSHLFVHVGPLFLELRGQVPSDILRLFAKEYVRSMQASLDKHLK